jgi:hypothetical protein
MSEKQKYIRLKEYNEIIIFPCIIEHSEFRKFEPVSAGFCYINSSKRRVDCFGESVSLNLKANPKEDTLQATKQVFGVEDMVTLLEVMKSNPKEF